MVNSMLLLLLFFLWWRLQEYYHKIKNYSLLVVKGDQKGRRAGVWQAPPLCTLLLKYKAQRGIVAIVIVVLVVIVVVILFEVVFHLKFHQLERWCGNVSESSG